ncbi:MAG: hypothetical protein LUD79_03760 [Oscillospiraceae bacterium]|nr:hypothetical protein [Oscillospiraceae bacterium]
MIAIADRSLLKNILRSMQKCAPSNLFSSFFGAFFKNFVMTAQKAGKDLGLRTIENALFCVIINIQKEKSNRFSEKYQEGGVI